MQLHVINVGWPGAEPERHVGLEAALRHSGHSGAHLLSVGVQTIISLATCMFATLRTGATLPALLRPLKALTGALVVVLATEKELMMSIA